VLLLPAPPPPPQALMLMLDKLDFIVVSPPFPPWKATVLVREQPATPPIPIVILSVSIA
jgi:hypothetical protein